MSFDFVLPVGLEATGPPESRGVERDGGRLLVANGSSVRHLRFADLTSALAPGDLLVINNSTTLPAALDATLPDGRAIVLHLSTRRRPTEWIVELRPGHRAVGPFVEDVAGLDLSLAGGATLTVIARETPRLWRARLRVEGDEFAYLARHGRAIGYSYLEREWPVAAYQTVFAQVAGSAEMPSAGRPFSDRLVTTLVARGITMAPITLHAGVSSPEADEPPGEEWWDVPAATADLVNLARANGRRVIAVGTTVTRALETASDERGVVTAGFGWTNLVLGPDRPARVVDGVITGWHEPQASHLALLEAVVGLDSLQIAYSAALAEKYLWHEFGDSALLLADRGR